MSTTVTMFRERFPEFSSEDEYSNSRIEMFLEDTEIYIGQDENRWKGKYNAAQAYLAAHLLIAGTASEAGDYHAKSGPIQSKNAGGVSVTRAGTQGGSTSISDAFMMTTTYGQRFLTIRNLCFVAVLSTSCH